MRKEREKMNFSALKKNFGRMAAGATTAFVLAVGMVMPASALSTTEATQLHHSSQAAQATELSFHTHGRCGWWNGWCGWDYGYYSYPYPYPYYGGGGYYPSDHITITINNSVRKCIQGGSHNHNKC